MIVPGVNVPGDIVTRGLMSQGLLSPGVFGRGDCPGGNGEYSGQNLLFMPQPENSQNLIFALFSRCFRGVFAAFSLTEIANVAFCKIRQSKM